MPPIVLLLIIVAAIVAAIVGQSLWEHRLLRVDETDLPAVWRAGVTVGLAISAVIGLGAMLVSLAV